MVAARFLRFAACASQMASFGMVFSSLQLIHMPRPNRPEATATGPRECALLTGIPDNI